MSRVRFSNVNQVLKDCHGSSIFLGLLAQCDLVHVPGIHPVSVKIVQSVSKLPVIPVRLVCDCLKFFLLWLMQRRQFPFSCTEVKFQPDNAPFVDGEIVSFHLVFEMSEFRDLSPWIDRFDVISLQAL